MFVKVQICYLLSEKTTSKQPYYFFCGFGYTNPQYRRGFGFHVTTEGDYIIGQDGIFPDVMQQIIDSAISTDDEKTDLPNLSIWTKQSQKQSQKKEFTSSSESVSPTQVAPGFQADLSSIFKNPYPGTLSFRWRIGEISSKIMLVDFIGGVTNNRISVIVTDSDALLLRVYDSKTNEISIKSEPYSPGSVLPVVIVWDNKSISFWIRGKLIGKKKLAKTFDKNWSRLLFGTDITGELSADIFRQAYEVDGLPGLNLSKGTFSEGARLTDVAVWESILSPREIKDLAIASDEEIERLKRKSHSLADKPDNSL